MLGILHKSKLQVNGYPRAFWLLFWGVFINSISSSMLWPFLTIYMYDKLQIPLSTITLLLSIRAIFSVLSTTFVTPYMDRIGRKGMMVFSLIGASIVFIGMAMANSLPLWILLISLQGTVLPIFGIGVNAMTADLVGSERRAPAYALIRAVTNAGIAIGPVIGGLLAVISFELTFLATGIAGLMIAVLIYMMLPETNPHRANPDEKRLFAGGYGHILSDRYFLIFIAAIFLNAMAYSHMFSLLPVYASENFGLIQSEYSLVFTVNAVIVVLFQYQMTHFTNRFRPFPVIAVGAVFYVLGTLSVASGSLLEHFMLSMAIVTIGELIINPTAITLVANIAPENMRARYLGIFSLGYPIGSGFGPVIGGILNDTIAPVAMWYGAAAMALCSVVVFLILAKIWREPAI